MVYNPWNTGITTNQNWNSRMSVIVIADGYYGGQGTGITKVSIVTADYGGTWTDGKELYRNNSSYDVFTIGTSSNGELIITPTNVLIRAVCFY